ncbi:MAG: helix-turn-helix domain-containing protein [Clostridia bacterium]|nr:helix-turn-helix domain-containing protein [Clostridia bacterium]MBQ7339194.1 helix-turn-helix domain-containing protein [Clostridia bacterium]
MTIGQRICELRKEKGYSQEYVAERLDVTRQAVSKWETDQCEPDTYNLIALSELFGVTVEYLATGKGAVETPSQSAPVAAMVGKSPLSMRQIAGLVFLTVCLLSSMLALVLQTPELLIFSAALLIGAIVLLVHAKHAGLIALWLQWVLLSIVMIFAAGSPLIVFSPFYYQNGFQINLMWIISVLYWVWLIVNLAWTVRVLWKRKKS